MQELHLGIGKLEITTKPGVILVTPGLGSCIGLAVYDKKSRMAGMAHVALPDSSICRGRDISNEYGKYADTAVPAILERMLSLGSKRENLVIKIVGGASMFSFNSNTNLLNIGYKNTIAVKKAIAEMGLVINKADTGGNKGRTFKLNVLKGTFYLRTIGNKEIEF